MYPAMKRSAFLSLLLALPLAANPIAVGVVLVPINPGSVPGANGSQWRTTLYARNSTDAAGRIECDESFDRCPRLAPHSSSEVAIPYADLPHQGFFLHTRSDNGFFGPPDIWLDLRSLDSASAGKSAGTQIPLPSINEFRTGTIVFPNVPTNGHSRIRLRIYSTADSTVTLRTFAGDQLIASPNVALTGGDPHPGPLPRYSAYAELEVTQLAGSESLRLEIDASTPAWASSSRPTLTSASIATASASSYGASRAACEAISRARSTASSTRPSSSRSRI